MPRGQPPGRAAASLKSGTVKEEERGEREGHAVTMTDLRERSIPVVLHQVGVTVQIVLIDGPEIVLVLECAVHEHLALEEILQVGALRVASHYRLGKHLFHSEPAAQVVVALAFVGKFDAALAAYHLSHFILRIRTFISGYAGALTDQVQIFQRLRLPCRAVILVECLGIAEVELAQTEDYAVTVGIIVGILLALGVGTLAQQVAALGRVVARAAVLGAVAEVDVTVAVGIIFAVPDD